MRKWFLRCSSRSLKYFVRLQLIMIKADGITPMKIVSIDIGSSYTNVVYGDDNNDRLVFPTLIAEVKQPEKESISVAGKHYLVGTSALSVLKEAPKTPNNEVKFHGSSMQYIVICYALEKSGINDEGTVLIRSVPYRDREEKVEELKSEKNFNWTNDEGEQRSCTFDYVNIIAQGVGAVRCYQLLNKTDKGRHILLAEIGSQTIDIVSLGYDDSINDYRMVHDECDSLRSVNVGKFMEWLNTELTNSGAENHVMGYHELSRALMDNKHLIKVKSGNRIETVDFTKEVQKVKQQFTRAIYEAITQNAGGTYQKADRIILAGGGAGLIDKDVWPEPEITRYLTSWADSVGQYHKVKELLEASNEQSDS